MVIHRHYTLRLHAGEPRAFTTGEYMQKTCLEDYSFIAHWGPIYNALYDLFRYFIRRNLNEIHKNNSVTIRMALSISMVNE